MKHSFLPIRYSPGASGGIAPVSTGQSGPGSSSRRVRRRGIRPSFAQMPFPGEPLNYSDPDLPRGLHAVAKTVGHAGARAESDATKVRQKVFNLLHDATKKASGATEAIDRLLPPKISEVFSSSPAKAPHAKDIEMKKERIAKSIFLRHSHRLEENTKNMLSIELSDFEPMEGNDSAIVPLGKVFDDLERGKAWFDERLFPVVNDLEKEAKEVKDEAAKDILLRTVDALRISFDSVYKHLSGQGRIKAMLTSISEEVKDFNSTYSFFSRFALNIRAIFSKKARQEKKVVEWARDSFPELLKEVSKDSLSGSDKRHIAFMLSGLEDLVNDMPSYIKDTLPGGSSSAHKLAYKIAGITNKSVKAFSKHGREFYGLFSNWRDFFSNYSRIFRLPPPTIYDNFVDYLSTLSTEQKRRIPEELEDIWRPVAFSMKSSSKDPVIFKAIDSITNNVKLYHSSAGKMRENALSACDMLFKSYQEGVSTAMEAVSEIEKHPSVVRDDYSRESLKEAVLSSISAIDRDVYSSLLKIESSYDFSFRLNLLKSVYNISSSSLMDRNSGRIYAEGGAKADVAESNLKWSIMTATDGKFTDVVEFCNSFQRYLSSLSSGTPLNSEDAGARSISELIDSDKKAFRDAIEKIKAHRESFALGSSSIKKAFEGTVEFAGNVDRMQVADDTRNVAAITRAVLPNTDRVRFRNNVDSSGPNGVISISNLNKARDALLLFGHGANSLSYIDEAYSIVDSLQPFVSEETIARARDLKIRLSNLSAMLEESSRTETMPSRREGVIFANRFVKSLSKELSRVANLRNNGPTGTNAGNRIAPGATEGPFSGERQQINMAGARGTPPTVAGNVRDNGGNAPALFPDANATSSGNNLPAQPPARPASAQSILSMSNRGRMGGPSVGAGPNSSSL